MSEPRAFALARLEIALAEWRDAGAPVDDVVLAIEQLIDTKLNVRSVDPKIVAEAGDGVREGCALCGGLFHSTEEHAR
jgi:hypothetical protein